MFGLGVGGENREAANGYRGLFDDAHDVVFIDDDVVFAVNFDFGAAPFGQEDHVPGLDLYGGTGAGFDIKFSVTDGEDFGLLGLFLGGFGEEDTAFGFGLGFDTLDEDSIREGFDFHRRSSFEGFRCCDNFLFEYFHHAEHAAHAGKRQITGD